MRYRFNDREIDIGACALRQGDEPLHVEPQVFDLILYLVENRSRVVDKEELVARVWKGRIVTDATIASRINAARRAVGDDGRRQAVIRTFSRRGFRFMADVATEGEALGRPAVAVLPFALVSREPGDDHLARGLADQLATTLGQATWFDVKDTAASFATMLEGMGPAEVASRLDAGYLVTGALHATAENLRISVRLVDPTDGRQVWSNTLEGRREEIFSIHDRMATGLLGEIEPRLRNIELQRSKARHGNFTAFDRFLRAANVLRNMELPSMRAACDELDRATAAYPAYAAAHGMRAWIATLMTAQGHRVDTKAELERSRLAVAEGAFDCDALAMGGYALAFFDRHPATGIDYLRRALAINPSSARANDHLGWLLLYAGRSAEASARFDRALALCPIDEFSFRMRTGRAFAALFRGDLGAAADEAHQAHAVAPGYSVCHRVLVAALAHLGRLDEAQRILGELLALNPGLTVARYARESRFEAPSDRETLFAGLRKAGLR